ncbi:MAG TPA: S8 family serine peptidase [Blastococcus sp.]|nr:S8 family serine peptidase [Blastococcus sp.]
MRFAVVAPAAALLVLASAAPALAAPPAPPLPALPRALAAELSPYEKTSLATLTVGSGVGVDAVVRTPTSASVVRLDTSTTADARRAVSLLNEQPGVTAGVTGVVRADGRAVGLTSVRPLSGGTEWDLLKVHGPDARALVAGSLPSVTVAVLDTGIAANPQLTPDLVPGQNFSDSDPSNPTDTTDNYFHGTHVAGTIGAAVGATGIEGVADGVRLMPVKVLDDSGSGTTSAIASGIIWAADHGADVINMSLGGDDDPAVDSAIDYARSKNVVVVAAVGNSGDAGNPVEYPGASPGVIGVAATDSNDVHPSFSEYGPQVDVAAPGVDVASLYLASTTQVAVASGTSMATPHVAATAALVKAVDRSVAPDQVEKIIEGAVVDLGALGRDDLYGNGRIDALAAVEGAFAADGQTVPVPPSETPLDALYRRLGGSAGFLGLPRTDPFGPLVSGGMGEHFQGGSIYWSPTTGAHAVGGAIRGRWAAGGWETSWLGLPTTDVFCGLRGGGCGQHFQGGSIYWSPATGAHAVGGAIRSRWAATGWETGLLGYPTTDLYGVPGGVAVRFQHGTITWIQRTGRISIT